VVIVIPFVRSFREDGRKTIGAALTLVGAALSVFIKNVIFFLYIWLKAFFSVNLQIVNKQLSFISL